MTSFLFTVVGALALALCVLGWMLAQAKKSLTRYRTIRDVEEYKVACEQEAKRALSECEKTKSESKAINDHVSKQRATAAKYQKLLGNLKTAADLQQRIKDDTAKAKQIAGRLGGLENAAQLTEYARTQDATIAKKKQELASFSEAIGTARTVSEIAAKVQFHENLLAEIKTEVNSVEEAREMQEFGFYQPRFNFDCSEQYKQRLDSIRQRQKEMLKAKSACTCDTEWTVEGSKREGQKMVNQQIKLMLRAYNGESDAAIGKAKYNNVVALENRVRKSFEQINKLGESKRIYLAPEYLNLKCDELQLAYEHELKKQEEKEEQRAIREQMREEEKAVKEIEKAKASADKDEAVKTAALDKAREELAATTGKHTAKLEELVAKLENELSEAIDRKAKAIARAQLTKSGHVYVLSNVGSFGEGVYKIGMTRRLEPLERVKELGDASVPFFFDVHAMIYSKNAPELENKLHKYFASRRVNMINLRREFFHVSLDEIRAAVAENFGQVSFVLAAEAAQYRETLAIRNTPAEATSPLQIA